MRFPFLLASVALGACGGEMTCPPEFPIARDGFCYAEEGDSSIGPRPDTGPRDSATPIDGAPVDSGSTDSASDASPDGGATDGSADADTGPVDTGPVDTGPVDTGPLDTGGPRPSCADIYGAAPSYTECEQRATECEFFASTGGNDCDAMCGAFGGTCIAMYDDSGGRCIRGATEQSCSTGRSGTICVCTR